MRSPQILQCALTQNRENTKKTTNVIQKIFGYKNVDNTAHDKRYGVFANLETKTEHNTGVFLREILAF